MTVKNCEKLEKSRAALTIEVNAEEFHTAIEKAYHKNRRKFRVPGFRPGKAPQKMIERLYGVEVFFEDALNEAVPDAYDAAVAEQKLRPVGMPELSIEEAPTLDGFTFRATVAVYPEVTLGQYKDLSAPKPEVTVSDADVDARINQLRERNTRLVSVEREAAEGDSVVMDFEGFLDGKPFQGGKGENYTLELGSHSFVPGFEEQLIGMRAGDERDLNITFPENYSQELSGKAVVFKVKVHEVKEKDAPEIDDEFAKDVSEFDTLQELRDDLSAKIAAEKETDAQRMFEDALMEKVADGITADIPEIMVDRQAQQFMENLKMQVARQGIPYEQYLQLTGADEEKLLQDARDPALRQVRMDLAIAAIIETEHLEASDEDIENEYQRLASEFGMDVASIKKYYGKERVREEVLTRKAVAVVADSATALPPEVKPAEDSAESAEDKPAESTEQPAEDKTAEAQAEVQPEQPADDKPAESTEEKSAESAESAPKKTRRTRAKKDTAASEGAEGEEKPKRSRKKAASTTADGEEKPKRSRRKKAETVEEGGAETSETPVSEADT